LDLRGIDRRHEPDPQFRAALQRRLASIVAGTDPGPVTAARDLARIDLEPSSTQPAPRGTGRRVAQIILAAASVVAIALVATRNDDATPADQPTVTVPSTTPVTSPPPPWSPELTARPLEIPITCLPDDPGCGPAELAVSQDGTLVVYDPAAATLTWYEDEPRVVPITAQLAGVHVGHPDGGTFESDPALVAIGPQDVAYFQSWLPETVTRAEPPVAWEFVAVAPSGAEITRAASSRGFDDMLMPTAQGLVAMPCTYSANRCTGGSEWPSPDAAVAIPWVDLMGNQITDTRPYPVAKGTDTGIEVRFGDREWLVAGVPWSGHAMPQVVPRSDGGVVLLHDLTFDAPGQPIELFELLPDGTIEHFVIDRPIAVLPDGSVIVQYSDEGIVQFIQLTPPS
jgi:hypothetical protein